MTTQQPPEPTASEPATKQRAKRNGQVIAAVFSGVVLVVGNLVALLYTVISWLMVPSGLGDVNILEGAWYTAFLGTVLALFTILLTIVPVAAGWLGKRWYIVPVVLFIIATTRWVYINTAYPGWST